MTRSPEARERESSPENARRLVAWMIVVRAAAVLDGINRYGRNDRGIVAERSTCQRGEDQQEERKPSLHLRLLAGTWWPMSAGRSYSRAVAFKTASNLLFDSSFSRMWWTCTFVVLGLM